MTSPSRPPPLPWQAILGWLLAAAALAWISGFTAGWFIRVVAPFVRF